jgi:N-sulfoglucosamine sulfohydrolase
LHGLSFLKVVEETNPRGWDMVFASHTFHEVTMYYPMRVVRTRAHKLILNLAHPLSFPFASDLYESATWQEVLRNDRQLYGARTVTDFIQRPRYELYDLQADPGETRNLAGDPKAASALLRLKDELREFQQRSSDPWLIKYEHE